MTRQFTDPPGHVRPYQFSTLTSGVFLPQEDKRFAKKQMAVFAVIIGLCAVVSVGVVTSSFSLWMVPSAAVMMLVFWVFMWIGFIKSFEWHDRRRFPEQFRLANSASGLGLLQAGDELDLRRKRLTEDGESNHPLVQPNDQGAAWQDQLRLERKLRTKQDVLLRELGAA